MRNDFHVCPLFKAVTSFKGMNSLPEGANPFLYEKSLMVWENNTMSYISTLVISLVQ